MVNRSLTHYTGRFLVLCVRFYQVFLSALFGPCCRFYPTCSEYTIIAIERHGPVKGSLSGLRRICRCHPWNPGGYDPVR
ncbi:MAG: membrane protein insertion efficiency factor YidD [Syntrophales bacterium]|nr:membrane protein insertion efficiency factor YidD [Syntrophales bacterium]